MTGRWRNWQTRTAQDRVAERPWGFKSPLAHEIYSFARKHAWWIVLAGLALIQLLAVPAHYLGAEHDDAQYAISAISLSRGRYEYGVGPGEPPLTSQTPGWPVLLLPAAWLFSASSGGLELWSWAWLAACDVLLWLWLRSRWGDAGAFAGVALFAMNPLILSRSGVVMSEIPAEALMLGLLARTDRPGGPAPGLWVGPTLALAWLVRPASLAMFPAFAAYYGLPALRRDGQVRAWRREGLLCLAVVLAAMGAWRAWVHANGAEIQEAGEMAASFSGRPARAIAAALAWNVREAVSLLGASMLPWTPSADYSGAARAWGVVLSSACLWGLWPRGRAKAVLAALLAAGFGGMHVIWPWWYERYLAAAMVLPVFGLGEALASAGGPRVRAAVLAALAGLVFAAQGRRVIAQASRSRPELAPTYEWIRSHTPEQSLFTSAMFCRDALYSARPFVPLPRAQGGTEVLRSHRVRYVLWQEPPDLGSSFRDDTIWARTLRQWREALARPPFVRVYSQPDGFGAVYTL